jgi:hypothetical protein
VDILCSKIWTAAIPFEAEMDKAIRTSILAHENREVRIEKWRSRLANLQRFLDASEPGNSRGPPGASVVAASCTPSLAQVIRSKSDKNLPSLSYILGDCDEPPVMATIHVKFVEMSVALLRLNPAMACAEKIEEWNTHHAKDWSTAIP